ncbi:MAG TPA: cupredoxin domain-containing protein [Steroidobacteraceae bacterium]|nr:cupredoxin domain-containing protein [Steroidobacteraceae bacterium]
MSKQDGTPLSRRGLLQCMAWAGTGIVWGVRAGVPVSLGLDAMATSAAGGFTFVQISDSHVGFDKAPNPDARATYREAVAKIKALPNRPAFILHTGDISHLSRDQEFDDADQIIREAGLPVFHVPGEHDMLDEGNGKAYLDRYGQGTLGAGWHSFDQHGIHFVGLVNVTNLKAGGMGSLGEEQIAWLEKDLRGRSASTPVVVFTHIPLWVLYAEWGWGTDDGVRALALLRRFGSVTVLNGHIHQVMQKVEGHIAFHTARSTAFPQPAPGTAPSPGPMKVPAEELHKVLGVRTATLLHRNAPLAIVDSTLESAGVAAAAATAAAVAGTAEKPAAAAADAGRTIKISNFTFEPVSMDVPVGASLTWVNEDDIPHTVVADDRSFKSKVLDSGQSFTFTFTAAGKYGYFCSLHPHMTGTVVVG